MGGSFYEYRFYIFSCSKSGVVPQSACIDFPKKVLFYLSNENNATPKYLSRHFHTIFKTYLTEQDYRNIRPFPLGYVGKKWKQNALAINDRKYNIFFSGNVNLNRMSLIRELSFFKNLWPEDNIKNEERMYGILRLIGSLKPDYSSYYPESYIKFTKQFMGGLSLEKYNAIMYNSKIALSPPGFYVNQTYRHYEAMRAGCAVISLQLPKCYFLKDAPIIQTKNWKEGLALAKKILDQPDFLAQLSNQSIAYFEKMCSETAIAKYITETLHNSADIRKVKTPVA